MGWNENKTYANYIKKRREEFNEAVEIQASKWRELERERDEARANLAYNTEDDARTITALESRLNKETQLTEESRQRVAELDHINAKLYRNNGRLRKAIEDAPHTAECASNYGFAHGVTYPCNCWKRDALADKNDE